MDCNRIQENIAWGRGLPEAERHHALKCPACSRAFEDFTVLQSALEAHLDGARVPEGFADRVMERVRREGRHVTRLASRQAARSREGSAPVPGWAHLRQLGLIIHFRVAYVWGVILLAFGLLVPSAI